MGLCTSRGKTSTSGLSLGLMSLSPVCPILLLAEAVTWCVISGAFSVPREKLSETCWQLRSWRDLCLHHTKSLPFPPGFHA